MGTWNGATLRWGLGLGLTLHPPCGRADEREWALRGAFESHRTRVELDGRGANAWAHGGAVEGAYGLAFSWSVLLRGALDFATDLRFPGVAPERTTVLTQRRVSCTTGLSYTPSDALTPVGRVEVGVAQVALVDRESRLQTAAGERRIPPDLPDTSHWSPVGRVVVGGEWRPVDRFGVTLAGHGQWIEGVDYGLGLALTWYGYR
jgi:hypothetical protein